MTAAHHDHAGTETPSSVPASDPALSAGAEGGCEPTPRLPAAPQAAAAKPPSAVAVWGSQSPSMPTDFQLEELPTRITSRIWVNPETGCWEWQGAKSDDGYGRIKHGGKRVRVHRLVYTLLVGPIPEGLTLDHVKAWGCRSRACCWPAHLEPLPGPDNTRRGGSAQRTHCPQGHPYDEENTYITPQGGRRCKTCLRVRDGKRIKKSRKSRTRAERNRARIEIRRGLAEDAVRMATEDGMTLPSWISALISSEIERRTICQVEGVHD